MDGVALVREATEASGETAAPRQHLIPSSPRLTRLGQATRWLKASFRPSTTPDAAFNGTRSWPRASPIRLLVATQLALGMLIAAVTVLIVMHLRDHALMEGDRGLRSTLGYLLAEQAERAFEGVDLVQTAILERLQTRDIRTPDEFRQRMSTIAVHEALRNQVSALPHLEAITVIDTDGNLVNFSRSWPIPKINVADRDYFKALQDDPLLTRFFSAPVQSRGSGSWTIFLARRISGPDHTFLGLLLAAVPLSYFEQLYREVAAAPDGAISMFRKDGVLLARYPHSDAQIGQSFGQNLAFTQQKATDTGIVIRKVSPVDGQERLVAARSLVRYPVVVNVMDTVPAILGEWRKQAIHDHRGDHLGDSCWLPSASLCCGSCAASGC